MEQKALSIMLHPFWGYSLEVESMYWKEGDELKSSDFCEERYLITKLIYLKD